MVYRKGCHTVYRRCYHVVWATKYRYDVLRGELRRRVREIIRKACAELGIEIIKSVLSKDQVHMFIAVPPQHALSDVMRRIKGRSPRRIQHVTLPRDPGPGVKVTFDPGARDDKPTEAWVYAGIQRASRGATF